MRLLAASITTAAAIKAKAENSQDKCLAALLDGRQGPAREILYSAAYSCRIEGYWILIFRREIAL